MWPALRLVLEGHATLAEMCGGTPTIDDVLLMNHAINVWQHGGRMAAKGGAS